MIHFKPWRFGRTEWIFIGIMVALSLFMIAISQVSVIADWYERITKTWTAWALDYGYWGGFLAALVGNLTIVIVFPYTIVTFFLASSGLHPLLLGVLTGVGAWIGEFSGYAIGRWGSRKFQQARPEEYQALERILYARPKLVQWLLFLFSALPLPDDVLFIPLGMLRYSIWKLFWPAVIGKVLAGLFITYTGSSLSSVSNQSPTSLGAILSQLGTLYAIALIMYAMLKVDWTRMMHRLLDEHPTRPLTVEKV